MIIKLQDHNAHMKTLYVLLHIQVPGPWEQANTERRRPARPAAAFPSSLVTSLAVGALRRARPLSSPPASSPPSAPLLAADARAWQQSARIKVDPLPCHIPPLAPFSSSAPLSPCQTNASHNLPPPTPHPPAPGGSRGGGKPRLPAAGKKKGTRTGVRGG